MAIVWILIFACMVLSNNITCSMYKAQNMVHLELHILTIQIRTCTLTLSLAALFWMFDLLCGLYVSERPIMYTDKAPAWGGQFRLPHQVHNLLSRSRSLSLSLSWDSLFFSYSLLWIAYLQFMSPTGGVTSPGSQMDFLSELRRAKSNASASFDS